MVAVHLSGGQHINKILRRYYDIDQVQWFYGVRGLDSLHPAAMIECKQQWSNRIERELETPLPIGQRIRVHSPLDSGGILDQDGTVRGYQDGEMLVRFDHQGCAAPLPPEWTFELLPGELVSHWQVWQVSESGERLLKDQFATPISAEYFAKQQERDYHQEASRRDDWVAPPRFEVRAVSMLTSHPLG